MRPDYATWFGRPVFDAHDSYVGTVGDVLVDDAGQPVWVEVQAAATDRPVMVPFTGMSVSEAGVRVPHTADRLMSAPAVAGGGAPSVDEGQLLRRHYASEPAPTVVLSEEELRISTEIRPTGTVRLRKWVETQTVSEEVVLHQERVRVERQPVGLGDLGGSVASAEIGEALYEVVLRDEHVVATKVTVPREVVRLSTHVVPDTVVVEADLRHEEAVLEDDRPDADATRPLGRRS